MHIQLDGKRAVISGSTSGIGYAIACGLAAAGARVVISGRDAERVEQSVASLLAEVPGADANGVAADLGTPAGAAQLIAAVPAADILINNLGIFEWRGSFFELADADWEHLFQVNVMSGVRLSRHYAQGMVAKGWGRIQFVASESGVLIPADMVHYGVSKAAQLAASRGLAETLAGTGVTVNSVLPGPTRTTGADDFFARLASEQGVSPERAEIEFVARQRPTSLIQRMARPEEVANMCVYLASEQASATTGAALRVEGGIIRAIS
jgi:NAD(P)-dependent dehydrogenase (short-subunit alcohol dehydrogenase family)